MSESSRLAEIKELRAMAKEGLIDEEKLASLLENLMKSPAVIQQMSTASETAVSIEASTTTIVRPIVYHRLQRSWKMC